MKIRWYRSRRTVHVISTQSLLHIPGLQQRPIDQPLFLKALEADDYS